MKKSRAIHHATHGPWGDAARHLSLAEIERGFARLSPPSDRGELALLVSRADDGARTLLDRVRLDIEAGMPDDAWFRDSPDMPEAQLAVMRVDVARLVANGQAIELAGDNLFVDLDLSVANLPCGSRIRIGGAGGAELEVTPKPHKGCLKFRQRFGKDALRFAAAAPFRDLRLRGIYLKIVEAGEIAVGDAIEVVSRV
jgi:hypothetical protein